MALSTNTKFWVSRALVMIMVAIGAIGFLSYMPEPAPESAESTPAPTKSKSIADSVSNFYAEFRQVSSDPIKEQFGEFTIILEDKHDINIGSAIEKVSSNYYEPIDSWQGDFKTRAFSEDSTLMKEATAHAAREGFNLVWDLDQDFVIRKRFQSTTTLTGMLQDIADAVDSHFNQPINIYYCSSKRAMVVTFRQSVYLNENCTIAG